jgi:hypothetical protein
VNRDLLAETSGYTNQSVEASAGGIRTFGDCSKGCRVEGGNDDDVESVGNKSQG